VKLVYVKIYPIFNFLQLSNVTILSKTPTWQDGKLPQTRVKNKLIGQVLIFKEAMWSTMRIEANALNTGDPQLDTTPLRIIANQSRVRVIVRKRLDGTLYVNNSLTFEIFITTLTEYLTPGLWYNNNINKCIYI